MKKLFDYCKKIVVSILIFCLTISSYASLSASDGASFVTKAEFDSAITDFNSRLTTFEAGINSKIDSQVSSYLDRNGIWSKKEQTLINDKIRITDATSIEGWQCRGIGKPFEIWPERKIVEEINKTGLAFIYLSLNDLDSVLGFYGESNIYKDYERTQIYDTYDPNSYLMRCLARSSGKYWFEFRQKDNTDTYIGDRVDIVDTIKVNFNLAPSPTNGVARYYVEGWFVPKCDYVAMLFVSKGNSLWTRCSWSYAPGQYSSSIFMASELLQSTEYNMEPKESGDNTTCAKPLNLSIEKIHIY